jgi:hypothetical protein
MTAAVIGAAATYRSRASAHASTNTRLGARIVGGSGP